VRPVGVLLIVASVVVGAALWFWPIHFSVLGTDVDCGAPILRVLAHDEASSTLDQAMVDECHSRARGRVILGVVLGTVLGIAGIVLTAQSRGGPSPTRVSARPGWYPDPESPGGVRWWDGVHWTARAGEPSHPSQPSEPVGGWFADPTKRYPLRWWDGTQWTAYVAGASGAEALDPDWPQPADD
jgi:hypothetical protein